MDASSDTTAITQAALQDVTRFLDKTEENLRSLAVNPYINTKHDEEAMVLSGNFSSMTQGAEDDIPVHVRIPHRCAVNREYRSRPQRQQLDWIISTNPLHVQPITTSEYNSEFRGALGEPRIFDTSTGKWRRRYVGKKKSRDVLLEPLSAPSPKMEEMQENVISVTGLDSDLTGAPEEPRIFDKSTGKWRRRYLGKKKSKDVLLEPSSARSSTVENVATATGLDSEIGSAPLSAPSSTLKENVIAATENSELTGTPGGPRIFDNSTGKWRRRYLGKKKSKDVLSPPLSVPSPAVEENVVTAAGLDSEIGSAPSSIPSSTVEEVVITATENTELTGAPGEPRVFDKSTGKWRHRYLGKKKSKDVLLEPSSAPSPAVEENVVTATRLDNDFTGAPEEPRIFDKSTGKWRRRYLGKKKSKEVLVEPSSAPSPAVEGNVATAIGLDSEIGSAPLSAPSSTLKENVIAATENSELTGAPEEPRIFDRSTGKWRRRYLGKKKSKDVLSEPLSAPSPALEEIGSKQTTGLTSNLYEFRAPNSSQNEKLETKKKGTTPPSSRDPMFDRGLFVSNQYKTDVEADLLKTAQELEQLGLKALSEIELSKTAWREKINVGVGSHAKIVDVSTASSEGIGEKERLNTAQSHQASNSLASQMQMQQAQASFRTRVRRPSLAEVEIQRDLNSDDFLSPKSSNMSDLTQNSLLTSHVDDEGSKKTTLRKSDIKSDNTPHRRRRLPRPFQSDISMLANKMRLKSRLRMRAKAARIRERKRLARATNDADECCCSPRLTPLRNILSDRDRIDLEPLKAPISIDSSRTVTRCDEQINLTQVLRIYGSGDVEEPYDVMPQRLAKTRTRGALANVLYGTNMIEIRLINTAIQSARRGQVNNWIFTHDEDVHTTPIVFAKTVLVQDHPPAPFCLSVASPFWVSIYQEQVASSKGGERFRDCVEVRSCKGHDMPCFEMSPLQREAHPFFKERIYLGKGIIRIERNVDLPSERESTLCFSNSNRISIKNQYRIRLPWRQIEGQSGTGIPRAPQLSEIRTTNRPHICSPKEQRKKLYRKTKLKKANAVTSPITSTSSYFNDNASKSSLSEAWSAPKKKGFSYITEHISAIQQGYKEPPVLKSPQKFYSGVVPSKGSPLTTDELSEGDTLPISPTQESLEEVSHDTSISPTQDSVEEASETTYAGEETGETATSAVSTNTSAGTSSSLGIFEYGVELEGSQNDIVTAVALPPVLLHIRRQKGEPLRNTGSVSYKYAVSEKKSSKLDSRSSIARKSKVDSKKRRILADELAENLYAGDVVVHEKLADNSLKLQLHLTSKIKDASKEEEDARFLPDRITVQGKDVWSGI